MSRPRADNFLAISFQMSSEKQEPNKNFQPHCFVGQTMESGIARAII